MAKSEIYGWKNGNKESNDLNTKDFNENTPQCMQTYEKFRYKILQDHETSIQNQQQIYKIQFLRMR